MRCRCVHVNYTALLFDVQSADADASWLKFCERRRKPRIPGSAVRQKVFETSQFVTVFLKKQHKNSNRKR